MPIKQFEDLTVWQDAQELAVNLFSRLKDSRNFDFKNQILRASVSISNNIAEGFERETKKEYIRYLYIAKGSCGEVRSMLYLAKEMDIINVDDALILLDKSKKISSKLMNLIRKISEG